jgi:hypothetical protein
VSSNRGKLLNAFTPSREILDPRLFAGRNQQIKEVADALQTSASCPLIYGDRGLGKSSLAIQSQLIAMGSDELLNSIEAPTYRIAEDDTFMTFYLTCTDEIKDGNDLINALVNVASEVEPAAPMQKKGSRSSYLLDKQTRAKVSFKLFQLETTRKYRGEVERVRYDDQLKPSDKLIRTVRLLHDAFGQPILFIIDELDRVKDLSGFPSLLKSLSADWLRFLLVGVAQNVADLNLDHPSIERILTPIRVPRMKSGELADTIDRVTALLREDGLPYTFSAGARKKLVSIANGFPWFIHVVGQRALLEAAESNRMNVIEDDVTLAVKTLTRNRFAQHFSDIYQAAVRDSYNREIVLRAFASWPGPEIPTANIYAVCKTIGVSSAATYKGHLVSEAYGSVLMAAGYQRQGLVRFRNEMFKQYIYLRPSLYQNADERVAEATKDFGRNG